MKIAVIGVGVVGGAIKEALEERIGLATQVIGYDKYRKEYQDTKQEILQTEIAFVCVPTLTKDRIQDLGPIHDVLSYLDTSGYDGTVALKCTVLPGTTERLSKIYARLEIVHNPEFLTAANAKVDLINQVAVLIGDPRAIPPAFTRGALRVSEFWSRFMLSKCPIVMGKSNESEMAKYIHNCFLATKVSVLNDFYEVCVKSSVDFAEAMKMVHAVDQVGKGHSRVPGPDGQRGWGGMCFPKDTEAMLGLCDSLGMQVETLRGAVTGNNRRRF